MRNILRNLTLTIALLKIPGVIELTKTEKTFANSGYASNFVLLLQEYLGFSYEIDIVPNSLVYENLRKNKIDLVLPVTQSFEGLEVIKFSYPLAIEGIKFFVAMPAELSKLDAITYPFLIQVWIAIFISFITSVMAFTIIFRKESKLYKRKLIKVNEITWALFGSFTGQGNQLLSSSGQCCKLLVLGWILAIFVITSSYSGALLSFLSFPGREFVPRTFSELVKMANKGDYNISTNHETTILKLISKSTEGAGLDLKKLLELNKLEDSSLTTDIIDRILKEKLAYVWYENDISIQISPFGLDNFLVSKDQIFTLNTGFGISRNFSYKEQLDIEILRFLEAGFMMKFMNDIKIKREKEYYSKIIAESEVFHVLTATDLAGPFTLLIIGYILSITVFFIEIIKSKIYY